MSKKQHLLPYTFTIYYLDRSTLNVKTYEEAVTKIASFSTVEEFWNIYSYLKRIDELEKFDYLLFRDSIAPMWEDNHNAKGGKWQIRIKKGYGSRCWELIILNWIGNFFETNDVTGIIVSTTSDDEVIISIWNENSSSQFCKIKIRNKLCEILNINTNKCGQILEYRTHMRSHNRNNYHDDITNNHDKFHLDNHDLINKKEHVNEHEDDHETEPQHVNKHKDENRNGIEHDKTNGYNYSSISNKNDSNLSNGKLSRLDDS